MSNDIIDVKPEMPALPNTMMPQIMGMFPNMIPVHIPQRTWKTGLVVGWHRGRKLRQIRIEAQEDALIARAKREMVQDNAEMVVTVVSMAGRLEAAMEKNKAEVELARANVVKVQLENQLLYHQVKTAEIESNKAQFEYKQMMKDVEE